VSTNDPDPSRPEQGDGDDALGSTQLGWVARSVAAVVGAAAGTAGSIGVFVEGTNSGGVPVLLTLGAFFGYLAISGQRLSHLKVAGNEAKFDRMARVTQRVLEDPTVPDATKGEVAEALDDLRAELPAGTRRAVSTALDTQQAAGDYLNRLQTALLRLFEAEYVGEVAVERDSFDTILRRSNRALFVRGRYRPVGDLGVQDVTDVRTYYRGDVYSVWGGLLVSNQPLSRIAQNLLEINVPDSKHVEFVRWTGPVDDENLKRAVNLLLSEDDESQQA
jgi:hypothetical protein